MSSHARLLIIGAHNAHLVEKLREVLKDHDVSIETEMQDVSQTLESYNLASFCTLFPSPYEKKSKQNSDLKKKQKKDRLDLNKKMAQIYIKQHLKALHIGVKKPQKIRSKMPQYRNKMR